ncbi:hypothetical protein JW613_13115 [Streptomyces smyrnaeus]|uniref:Uncharacterized protein n=1 Tax=Streptomyces smyrnaeus TaxID=1387713 RepID=A0ABS3XVZ3_9ACTN|nr:hypothetical protein [Streptomyces smyrnaeus]
MAQPPLFRAIAHLERRMGVRLLDAPADRRTSPAPARSSLAESRKALDAVTASVRRAQRAGRTDPQLTLARKPNGDAGLLESILRHYRHNPADPGPAGRAPRTHRLADRAALTLADLTGEQLPRRP